MEIYRELTGIYGTITKEDVMRASTYIVLTGDDHTDYSSIVALENLRLGVVLGVANDKLKYCLPESMKVKLASTWNARSLQNFLALRSSKSALWEIRDLAQAIFDALPDEHKYLFEHCLGENHE